MKKFMFVVILLIASPFVYFQVKSVLSEHAVKNYLIEKKGIKKENIEELYAFFAKSGEHDCLVYVKLKGNEEGAYYHKDFIKNKVVFDEVAP